MDQYTGGTPEDAVLIRDIVGGTIGARGCIGSLWRRVPHYLATIL